MSRSSFSKAYEEMTFTIHDADLDKLYEVLKDINVKECPWFEVQDKHGNKAKYYREPHWIPCSERLPNEDKQEYLVTAQALNRNYIDIAKFTTDLYSVDKYDFHDRKGKSGWYFFDSDLGFLELHDVVAWMPLPSLYRGEGKEE